MGNKAGLGLALGLSGSGSLLDPAMCWIWVLASGQEEQERDPIIGRCGSG